LEGKDLNAWTVTVAKRADATCDWWSAALQSDDNHGRRDDWYEMTTGKLRRTDRQTDRVAVVKLFTNNTLIGDIEERDEVSRTRLNYIPETGHLELTRPSSWADPIKQMYNTHWTADVAVVAGYTPASVWTAVLGMLHHDHVVCRTWRVERLELTVLHRVWNNHHKHKLE